MPINLTTTASIRGQLTADREGGTAGFEINEAHSRVVGHGTGIGQANAAYVDDFSIAASGALDIDLSGALEDALGNALVFTAIKEILIITAAGNVNNVVVGGHPTAAFVGPFGAAAHTAAVPPGERFSASNYSAAGWPVTAGSADILRLANSAAGSAVDGTIVIVGEV